LEPGTATALVGAQAWVNYHADLWETPTNRTAGNILIAGQDLRHPRSRLFRRQSGLVSTDGRSFRVRLADNIRYKRPSH